MHPRPPRRRKVTFLTFNAYGIGGVARVVANIASALADHHDVEVLSVLKSNPESTFPYDERVAVHTLFDATRAGKRWRANHPDNPRVLLAEQPPHTRLLERDTRLNALAERRLEERLGRNDADVIISTRPSLHMVALDMARPGVPLVGWEHLNFATRYNGVRMGQLLDGVVPELDAWVTLTDEDRIDYVRHLGDRAPLTRMIRNSSGMVGPATRPPRDSKIVVGAGRLQERKGFDRAIEAWQPLVERFPDWQFHIYGHGPDQKELQKQIDDAGLHDTIKMMGYTNDIERVLAEAELFLLSSRAEGFGMVIVEAMSQGTPAISFDCPRGPSEIITTGRNGEIVADGDIPGLTDALARMMGDDELRCRLGEQALVDSREYEMDHIVARWNELIDEVSRSGAARRTVRRVGRRAARRVLGRPLRALRRRRDG